MCYEPNEDFGFDSFDENPIDDFNDNFYDNDADFDIDTDGFDDSDRFDESDVDNWEMNQLCMDNEF